MNNNSDSIEELNILMDKYLEAEDFEKVEEVSREICRLQGLKAADRMPDDFIFRIVKKEKKDMNRFKKILKHTTKAAAVAALVLLAGGTVSAAVMHNSGVNIFKFGLSTGGVDTESKSEFESVKLPELPEDSEDNKTLKEHITGGTDNAWIEKNVWDEEYLGWSSDDKIVWEEYKEANHITEYKYKDYKTAAEDVGFGKVLKSDYMGEATYTECEHLEEDEESKSADYSINGTNYIMSGTDTDCSISGEFVYGNGKFTLDQNKLEDASNTECIVITGETTTNGREYVSSTGYVYKLTDDEEFGEKRTTMMAVIGEYELVLTFMGMSEEEIHTILEDIDLSVQ
ncbi:MAG: hypothetical protein K2M60_10295 [Lachnospiraceae bacterium]|nr:hypothetical protein [Lachnospiraceae bacterium]MDE6251968.1 hypothetical protein [Lachnospiraceae bacterium]